jgi:hypothetical protein
MGAAPQSLTENAANEIVGFQSVMPGLVPGIHVLTAAKTWMAGTSPATTGGKAPEYNGRVMSQTLRMRTSIGGSAYAEFVPNRRS